jgi:HPt (histidine-containing phosphotransfer) domain-containing protein
MSNAFAGPLGQEAASAGATRIFAKNAFGPRRVVNEVRGLLGPNGESTEASSPDDDATKSLAQLRKTITAAMPQRIGEIRDRLQEVAHDGSLAGRGLLLDLHRAIHQLAGTASAAGFNAMAQMACALETLAKEMHANSLRVNPSSLRTAAQGVEVLAELSERTSRHLDEGVTATLILVVDDETVSRETTCTALERRRSWPGIEARRGKPFRFDFYGRADARNERL